jgi:transcriptional regulator with XRE-family HTH domain
MSPDAASRLAELLRTAREGLGLSVREVAKRSGVVNSNIVRLEQGAIPNPRPETLKAIADVLELDLADVFASIGYVQPKGLPSFTPYLRSKYGDMPESAVQDLQRYFTQLAKKHGLPPDGSHGPQNGEDEH